MTTVRTYIRIRFEWTGLHYWEGAPEGYEFLREPHRHKFHASVTIETTHNDREIEFFAALAYAREHVLPGLGDESLPLPYSCERYAQQILADFRKQYGEERYYSCEVSEDGENGGLVEVSP